MLLCSFQRPAIRSMRKNLLFSTIGKSNKRVSLSTTTLLRCQPKEHQTSPDQETKSTANAKSKADKDTHTNCKSDVQLITTTEVSTSTGVRWLDIAGRTHAWTDDLFHREGDFVAYAMEALRNWELPPDMIQTVSHNQRPLPFVHVEDTWACLTLRCERQKSLWLSSILNAKVKDFRRSVHTRRRRSNVLDMRDDEDDENDYSSTRNNKKNKNNNNDDDDDDDIFLNDKDEARVRSGRRHALRGESNNINMNNNIGDCTKGSFSSRHATMVELTDRFHIFLLKESHPSNEVKDGLGATQASVWRSKEYIVEEENKKDSEDQLSVRWRVVTVHRYRVPFIEDMLTFWATSSLREETWVGIVRQLVHGTTRSVQNIDYRYAERLDELEVILFAPATKMSQLCKVLTQVHVIHRRANIHANLLRETQRCYMKLFKSLNVPINIQEQREILYLTNALSLAEELHDQSRSLLALQFSVAAYMLEDHLRILTIFTTFFIPLELITSSFGTNFVATKTFFEDIWGMYFSVVLLVITGAVTNVWMRRTVISH
ncbi:Mg2+ transporter protein [Trypanosoma melophagium]|uniref:Mg2+ transporter protein n=1 Tax=Trypanosoma melophagium TaxID=715481 RepID=UPI00351A5B9A|nr:Mg2+ transporter protein [Trypanosoma melophagium]